MNSLCSDGMATDSPTRWSRIRRRVLESTPTSVHFQEALRLCRHHHEDQQHPPQTTDDDTSLSGDVGSSSSSNRGSSSRGSSSSNSSSSSRSGRNNVLPGQQRLLPDPRTPSPEDPNDSVEEWEPGRGRVSSRTSSYDSTPRGLHVRWADQSQQDLVTQTPRKRYRRPSLIEPNPPKSILKAVQG